MRGLKGHAGMKVQKRQLKLVEIVRKKEKASVEELAQKLGASRETIRRDLAHLAKAGKIQKVHGGATIPRLLGEGPYQHRLSENVDAKTRIARAAVALFQPGETLFIDTGTTTLYFAEEITRVPGLTIVTNSTEIARTVAKAKNGSQVYLLGGEFRVDNSQTVGAMVTAQVRAFRAHHAVLTIGAIDRRTGAMDYDFQESVVAQTMIEQSQQLTVLADSSKFELLASFEVCPLSSIGTLVCDTAPPPAIREELEKSGGKLIVCSD